MTHTMNRCLFFRYVVPCAKPVSAQALCFPREASEL